MDLTRCDLHLPNGAATLLRAPGVPEAPAATAALLKAVRRVTAERVFVMGPGATATALWAARTGAEVVTWTENLAEEHTLTATFSENGVPSPRSFLQADFAGLEPESCDLALIHLPRGRALQAEALRLGAALLRPGGRLYFVGATKEGVRSALEQARALFGQANVLVRQGGYHAGVAPRPTGDFPLPEVLYEEHTIIVDDLPTRLISPAGVFAGNRLDEGAASLIAGMRIAPGARVLDLGCGTGLVGLAALRRGAQVTAVDVSARAVAATRRTLAANGYPETVACLSIGVSAIAEERFDIVVTNPPFHQGRGVDFEVARLFIAGAARVLRPGGSLYLVANAFLRYEPWLKERFPRVGIAWESRRFKVWETGGERIENGEWRMENGEWRMENGESDN